MLIVEHADHSVPDTPVGDKRLRPSDTRGVTFDVVAILAALVLIGLGLANLIAVDDLDWIEAAGNYVRLHVGNDGHLLREPMNSIEARLNPETFFRIHRSHIVNIERIKELQPWFNGEYVVILRNGSRLTLSRGYREKLQERLGQPF